MRWRGGHTLKVIGGGGCCCWQVHFGMKGQEDYACKTNVFGLATAMLMGAAFLLGRHRVIPAPTDGFLRV